MFMTGGTAAGAAADAAALLYSSGDAEVIVGGGTGILRVEGGFGPFFPPFDTGVFNPNAGLFHLIGGASLVSFPAWPTRSR